MTTRGHQINKNRVKVHNARFMLVIKDVLFDDGMGRGGIGRKVLEMKNEG